MIKIEPLFSKPRTPFKAIIIGVGGAGCNLIDRIGLDGFNKNQLMAANTDIQTLSASIAGIKVQLGRSITRGLGTGGDPDLGIEAAQESRETLDKILEGAELVFLCGGLGGGTGSGALPVIAQLAHRKGALVIAFVVMPFSFEGNRRLQQANRGLELIRSQADAVICFENDRMIEVTSVRAGIHEAFATTNQLISHSILAIHNLAGRPGLIPIGLDDLFEALRCRDSRCVFGYGEGSGDNGGHDALASALKSPLLNRSVLSAEGGSVLVNISGGTSLTLAQVQTLMEELLRHIGKDKQILFGVSVDKQLEDKVSIVILSSVGSRSDNHDTKEQASLSEAIPVPDEQALSPDPVPWSTNDHPAEAMTSVESEYSNAEEDVPPTENDAVAVSRPIQTNPSSSFGLTDGQLFPEYALEGKKKEDEDIVGSSVKNRFVGTEPTMSDGENLDIPTFMRKSNKQ